MDLCIISIEGCEKQKRFLDKISLKQGMSDDFMDKTKILIIEDDEAIADLLAYGLTSEGFETCTVNNGSSGMRKLDQFKPDLLLLDWMLPDCSGLDICKTVTESIIFRY